MCPNVDGQVNPASGGGTSSDTNNCSSNNNNNNNSYNNNNINNSSNSSSGSNVNSGNSGSQYALCALGVGLLALGTVMIVWSGVPADPGNNTSSSTNGGDMAPGSRKNKASSVAFVLVVAGVVMLLLSLCLGMRNKQREMHRLQELQNRGEVAANQQDQQDTVEEQAQRYAVPTYEEAVGSGQYPVSQSNVLPSSSQLPSYDDLVQVDVVQYEFEGPEVTPVGSQPVPTTSGPAPAASTSNRRLGKNSRKLLPIKIRRIKSEKFPMKNGDNCQPATGMSIEPLTPPPQYEDKLPPL